ncbi:unnamed protein product [Linum tenue]|uniref:Bifunctional inhibitor/plant lipid transfer protein/seed storage helical domain-containing protein n=1 Tax=Linum tenue TaxID=586396 RepID=A0AAV0LET2_9ROSI|nr:unnamed protein product [Linum tenue]
MAVSSLFLLISHSTTRSDVAIVGCNDVRSKAKPCFSYAEGKGDQNAVPPAYCDGIHNISNEAKTAEDEKGICNCLKQLSDMLKKGLVDSWLQQIPGRCAVNVLFKLSIDADCDKFETSLVCLAYTYTSILYVYGVMHVDYILTFNMVTLPVPI